MKRIVIFLVAVLILLPLASAVDHASILLLPNMPAILAAGNGTAVGIIYAPSAEGADAAFISATMVAQDGMELPNGDTLRVIYDKNGLHQIRAGGEPSRAGWVDLPVGGNTVVNITQRIYSSASGYEATFTPSIPLSLAGKRVWIGHANEYWFIGDMNASSGGLLLYKEAAYGRIEEGKSLSYDEYGLSFITYDGEKVLVQFRAGLEPTYFAVQQLHYPDTKTVHLVIDYNFSEGPVLNADCYLVGAMSGSLAYLNGQYRGEISYLYLAPDHNYAYGVRCAKEGFEPKELALWLNVTADGTVPSLPAFVPIGEQPIYYPPEPSAPVVTPGQPVQPTPGGLPELPIPSTQPENFIDQIVAFFKSLFWWIQ